MVLQETDQAADERGQNPGNEVPPHSVTIITGWIDDLPLLSLAQAGVTDLDSVRDAVASVGPNDSGRADDEKRKADQQLDQVFTDDPVGDQEHSEVADIGLAELISVVGQCLQSFAHAHTDSLAKADELGILAGFGLGLFQSLLALDELELLRGQIAAMDRDHVACGLRSGLGHTQSSDQHENDCEHESLHRTIPS